MKTKKIALAIISLALCLVGVMFFIGCVNNGSIVVGLFGLFGFGFWARGVYNNSPSTFI